MFGFYFASNAAIYVKGKGGIVVEGKKKTICPEASPYVCAVVRVVDNQDATQIAIGDLVEVTTSEGEEYTGNVTDIQPETSCNGGCLTIE